MIKTVEEQMAATLQKQGVVAEITFCQASMFSVLVDDAEQFERAKQIMASVKTVQFDSEDRDNECGHIAFYRF